MTIRPTRSAAVQYAHQACCFEFEDNLAQHLAVISHRAFHPKVMAIHALLTNRQLFYGHRYNLADSTSVANTIDFLEGLRWCDGSSQKTADGGGPYNH